MPEMSSGLVDLLQRQILRLHIDRDGWSASERSSNSCAEVHHRQSKVMPGMAGQPKGVKQRLYQA